MPLITKAEANERNEGRGATMAAALLEIATPRAISPADLFCSLAAMVMRQNPNLGAKLLGALELSVRQHPAADVFGGPLGNVSETAPETVTETATAEFAAAVQEGDKLFEAAVNAHSLDVSALVASPTVTVTAPEAYCGPFDDVCQTPEACRAAGCQRNPSYSLYEPAAVTPPADVAFEAPANAATATA